MNPYRFLMIIPLLFVSAILRLHAQETQVPVDSAGTISVLTPELESRVNLFRGYPGFQEARLYQLADSTFALEIVFRRDSLTMRERKPMSAADTRLFRQKVTDNTRKPSSPVTGAGPDQSGRPSLLINSAIVSLGFYGWALPTTLNVGDGKAFIAMYMLTSSAGFFVPFALTGSARVTSGAASLSNYGSVFGIGHGIMLSNLIGGESTTENGELMGGILTSVTEGIAGYFIADRTNMSAGKAQTIATMGTFGTAFGFGISHVAGLFDQSNIRSVMGVALLGTGVGYLAGNMMSNVQSYSEGDALVLANTGVLGAWLPLATILVVSNSDQDPKLATGIITAGGIAGLILGHTLVRGKEFSAAQGTFISLGTLSGTLLGGGIGYLISSGNDYKTIPGLAAVGSIAGFWFMYSLYVDEAKAAAKGVSWHFELSPSGLTTLMLNDKSRLHPNAIVPILNISAEF